MFEIRRCHDDFFTYLVNEGYIKYGGEYDFTFEDRFLIYHANIRHRLVYFAMDKTTRATVEVNARLNRLLSADEYSSLIPDILNATKYTGDRRFISAIPGDPLEAIDLIFREIMPRSGYLVREEQIRLSKAMYKGMADNSIAICEAEVGTGKSLAYLVAGFIAKETGSAAYIGPVTIATSSIELQHALITKDIPMLSKMLMDYHLISKPLTAILRKGKEHYLCPFRCKAALASLYKEEEKNAEIICRLEKYMNSGAVVDLDKSQLPKIIKDRVCVIEGCTDCRYAGSCAYAKMVRDALSDNFNVDFQVTNQNMFIANCVQGNLLRDSQYVVIDEAHKLRSAAQDVFGTRLTFSDIHGYINTVRRENNPRNHQNAIYRTLDKLDSAAKEIEQSLKDKAGNHADGDAPALINPDSNDVNIIRSIQKLIKNIEPLRTNAVTRENILGDKICEAAEQFKKQSKVVTWLEREGNGSISVCCVPNNIANELYKNIWRKNKGFVLTSGTMSDGANFDYFKDEIGIFEVGDDRIKEYSMESPFDYAENTRLYIAGDLPVPEESETFYEAVSDRIVDIVNATNGHSAILFTSYRMLQAVYETARHRLDNYDLVCMSRDGNNAIDAFKECENGVIFASGSMWEGVDIAGDALSSVIIARLPFPVRSALTEEQKRRCGSVTEFIDRYAVPEMLIKLRQGAGRLVRTETDSGVVAILDSRAENSVYSSRVKNTMRKYPRINSVPEIGVFMREHKPKAYFSS